MPTIGIPMLCNNPKSFMKTFLYRKFKGLRPLHLYVAPISVEVCLEKSLHLGKAQDRVSR
jgi:hypothetical protein